MDISSIVELTTVTKVSRSDATQIVMQGKREGLQNESLECKTQSGVNSNSVSTNILLYTYGHTSTMVKQQILQAGDLNFKPNRECVR